MSAEYALVARRKRFSVKISAEVTGVRILSRFCPAEVRTVFGGADEERVSRVKMLSAVDELLRATEEHRGELGCTYKQASGQKHGPSTGVRSGLRLPGDDFCYALETRAGICRLEKMRMNADGRGELVEEIDVRDRSYIETVNAGRLTIVREETADDLLKLLRGIKAFLAKIDDEYVVKTGG